MQRKDGHDRNGEVILFGKKDCDLCRLTARRFKKWDIPFTMRHIDEEFTAMAEYCFYLGRKLDPELPMVVIDGKDYSRPEAYKILAPQGSEGQVLERSDSQHDETG